MVGVDVHPEEEVASYDITTEQVPFSSTLKKGSCVYNHHQNWTK